ncbi:MAG TPA: aldehyde dehydrogenase family protein [Pyrinomonadaceae bacterium]|nr:aldehyde dehydrogenase family protein [Pyrinomonadaceae bacterium]
MLHIPLLRKGQPYKSLDAVGVAHHRTRAAVVEISQANVGLIRRDLSDQEPARRSLAAFTTEELIGMTERAAEIFANDELPVGDAAQTPRDYVEQVSATTGLPHVMARRNMQKVRGVMAEMRTVLAGLTRNLPLDALDRGYGEVGGQTVSFFPRAHSLGVVLPSNSPGVHTLWTPAVALKTPLVLKPGGAEPWTPYRVAQAFIKAGVPAEAFSYYPTSHAGAAEILTRTGRGMVFGDAGSTAQWREEGRVEVHGPGYSKLVLGEDCAVEWEKYLDVIASSILDNGGRSCVNASGVWTTAHAEEIAAALARRFATVSPRAAEDEGAQLAPFADPRVAARVSAMIDEGLAQGGARDVTSELRGGASRVVEWGGCTYLLPTVVVCESPAHPLANREFLFPFASVVKVKSDELPAALGASLVVTALTRDDELIGKLLSSPFVDRLNVGALPTNQLCWDQPHEGNLFEHLYARRAFQRAAA